MDNKVMAKDNRKMASRALSVIVSVAAIVSLVIGSTFAYLSDSSEPARNTFEGNKVFVDLEETPGDYNIIPGTEQEKDPTVILDSTVDSYVFVLVEDNTRGIVDYAIADGWTLLDGYSGDGKMYYRAAEPSDSEQSFDVLRNNKVSYPASITNDDMYNADGTPKAPVELTFTAYAIQKDPFTSPLEAWENIMPVPHPIITDITDQIPPDGIVIAGEVYDLPNFYVKPTASMQVEFPDELIAGINESEYYGWNVDFTVSFNKDIDSANPDTMYGGQVVLYGQHNSTNNVPVLIMTEDYQPLPAGQEYRLMPAALGINGIPYEMLPVISPFVCGAMTKNTDAVFSEAHPDPDGNGMTYGFANTFGGINPDILGDLEPGTTITVKVVLYEVGDDGEETGKRVVSASKTFALS